MFDSAAARRMMVDGQVRTADVHNPELIAAMLALPRERFVPPARAEQAYVEADMEIAKDRVLLKPMVLAKLIQAARVQRDDHVLDVGCGFGYSSAVLAQLAGSVVALEQDADWGRQASDALAASGAAAAAAKVVIGPLAEGWAGAAPYDFILLNGATEIVPDTLGKQLKPNGRLACIFGRAPPTRAMIFRLAEGRLVGRSIFDAAAPTLPGFAAVPTFVF